MEIATGKAVNTDRSRQMMDLLKRDYSGTSSDADDQAQGFTGIRVWWSRIWFTSSRTACLMLGKSPASSRHRSPVNLLGRDW
jgi:hypothetical protein